MKRLLAVLLLCLIFVMGCINSNAKTSLFLVSYAMSTEIQSAQTQSFNPTTLPLIHEDNLPVDKILTPVPKTTVNSHSRVTGSDKTAGTNIPVVLTSAPDLIVETITLSPPIPSIGDRVTFTVTITNQGNWGSGSFYADYYIDDAHQTSIDVNPMSPGTTATKMFVWKAQAGSHIIKVVVDYENKVIESDETNNVKTFIFSTVAPDLIIDEITWSPLSPSIRDTVTFTVTIKNNGSGEANLSRVYLYIDGLSRGFHDVERLGVGANVTKNFIWKAQAGSYTVEAVADGMSHVIESDETNNTKMVNYSTPAPDLIIEAITWSPASPSTGNTVTFTITAKNIGTGKADYYYVDYYIDDNYQASVYLNQLNPGAVATKTFTWIFQEGFHSVKAVADSRGKVAESDETNNAKTVALSKTTVDLIVNNITWSSANLSIGHRVTFTVTIKNQGTNKSGSSQVQFYIDGLSKGYQEVDTIEPGATATETFNWTVLPGSHSIQAVADFTELISESDETNNTKTVAFSGPSFPDLTVQGITWTPASPLLGDIVTFTVTIKNIGSGTADPSSLHFYVDDFLASSREVQRMNAGTTVTKTFTWTAQAGSHIFEAVADSKNWVVESDETNNIKTTTLSPPAPDLIVEAITWSPASPLTGETVTFTVTIMNQGNDSAGYSHVAYYIDESPIGYHSVPWINAGTMVTRTFTWTVQPGSHTWRVVADIESEIVESDEKNNDKTVIFPAPDLIVEAITWSPVNPSAGDKVDFIVTIKNQSNASSGSSSVNFYISDSSVGYENIPEIDANNTVSRTFSWTAQEGSHTIKAIVDETQKINESDESNNEVTATIYINPPPTTVSEIKIAPRLITSRTPVSKEQGVEFDIWSETTTISTGQDIILNIITMNLAVNPTTKVQLEIEVPDGMSITSPEFIQGDRRQYISNYILEPGDIHQVEVYIRANKEGIFDITGKVAYHPASDDSSIEYQTLSLPVTVELAGVPEESPTPAESPENKIWSKWWLVLAAVAVLGGIAGIVLSRYEIEFHWR